MGSEIDQALDALAKAVGRRVFQLRRARRPPGNTLTWLASKTGLSLSFLSMIENGRRLPSLGALVLLPEALEVSVGELLGAEAPPGDLLGPINDLFRKRRLGRKEARRLLEVAKSLFPERTD